VSGKYNLKWLELLSESYESDAQNGTNLCGIRGRNPVCIPLRFANRRGRGVKCPNAGFEHSLNSAKPVA
jgi:hypothetical protein